MENAPFFPVIAHNNAREWSRICDASSGEDWSAVVSPVARWSGLGNEMFVLKAGIRLTRFKIDDGPRNGL